MWPLAFLRINFVYPTHLLDRRLNICLPAWLYTCVAQKGEMPDSKSKALQKLAQDFGATCVSIGKSLGKKGGEADAGKAYDKASEILVQYLKGVELDPLGSEAYN